MRKLFSVLATIAVAVTLSVGTAQAANDNDGNGGADGSASGSASSNTSTSGTGVNGTVGAVGSSVTGVLGSSNTSTSSSTSSSSTTATTAFAPCPPGTHNVPGQGDKCVPYGPRPGVHHGGPWYPGLPGNFPRLINNTYLPVNLLGLVGVGNVDVCTYSDWNTFDRFGVRHWANRWGGARGHFGPNPAATWLALRAAARCGSTVVVQTGLPNLVNGSYLNLGTYGLNGTVSVCQYPTFDSFSRVYSGRFGSRFGDFRGRFGRDLRGWNAGWNHLRLQASCAPSVVVAPSSQTIVQEAPTTTVEAAPQVTSSDPSDSDTKSSTPSTKGSVPSGSVASGGFDAAHLR